MNHFGSFCICFYDAGCGAIILMVPTVKYTSAYNVRCIKIFFGLISTTVSLACFLQLGLPSFSTLMHNFRFSFAQRITMSDSSIVQCLRWLR